MVDTQEINLDDFYEDRDYNKTFQLLDGTTPVNITGYNFEFKARLPESSTNKIDKVMSIATAASGLFAVSLDSSDTNLSTGRVYSYQVQGTTLAGEQYVYVTGEFEVKKTY